MNGLARILVYTALNKMPINVLEADWDNALKLLKGGCRDGLNQTSNTAY